MIVSCSNFKGATFLSIYYLHSMLNFSTSHMLEISDSTETSKTVQSMPLIVSVPVFYPFHDVPNDYWRFSEYSLRELFSEFNGFGLIRKGMKGFPVMYIITLKR